MPDPMPNVLPPTGPIERMPNVRQPNKWCPELTKIHSNAVFQYQPHEIAISRTEGGHLAQDVVMIPAVGNAICYMPIPRYTRFRRRLEACQVLYEESSPFVGAAQPIRNRQVIAVPDRRIQ